MNTQKKIAIIFTGGTISMKLDEKSGAAIPALSYNEVLSKATGVERLASIEVFEYSTNPSPHICIEDMVKIKNIIKEFVERTDIDGVVVTHGTDTLEETAFFVDLCLSAIKPIVFTASMRNSSELGYDGPCNLTAAICTACSEESCEKGVLVVLNNEVNSAVEVTKSHTMSLDTFKSMEFGPLGIVDGDRVIFYRNIVKHTVFNVSSVEDKVYLIKAVAGMDSAFIDFAIKQGAKGIVVEAMGRGNLPPLMVNGIKNAINQNIAVVIVSRCPMGRVHDSYGYTGGGKMLRELGAIFAGNLNGQKARIKLMVALSETTNRNKLKMIFEEGMYK